MKKRTFEKLMNGLTAGAMTLILCMSTAVTAFAGNETLPNGTPSNPAGAAITKVLQMPQGTATPTATFTFEIEKVSLDSDTSAGALTAMPELTGSISIDGTSASTVNGDVKVVTKNTGDILDGISWTRAGEYIYKVTETGSTYSITDPAKETISYSQAEYDLHVYIAESETGALYVKSAGAVIIVDQSGGTDGVGDKVDPTVPPTIGEGNNFKFINTYTKTPGGGELPDPDLQSAAISKAVAGDLSSTSKYFPFEVTIANNSLVTISTYKAYICTLSGGVYSKVSAVEADNQYDTGVDYVTFAAGTLKEINLKDSQYLVFMDCPQGSVYTANEKAVSGYIASVHIVVGGTAISPDPANAAANTALTTGARVMTAGGANTADFTNTYSSTIPTGVIINNLPFIAMVLAGIGAFVVYIVRKRRKMTT